MTRYLVDTSAYSAFMRGHEELRDSFQIADIPIHDVWIAASAMQQGLCVLVY